MTSKIDWNTVGNAENSSGGEGNSRSLTFIRWNDGNVYHLRPLGSAIQFLKAGMSHNGSYRSIVIDDPDNPTIKKYSNMNIAKRYAVNVLDRDDNKIKIMEGPISIFRELGSYHKHTGRNPGAAEGGDFRISVTGNLKQRRYKTEFEKNTTLTAEEKAMIKKEGLFDLEKIFKVVENDQIEEKLFDQTPSSQTTSDNVEDELGLDGAGAVAESAGDDLDLNF